MLRQIIAKITFIFILAFVCNTLSAFAQTEPRILPDKFVIKLKEKNEAALSRFKQEWQAYGVTSIEPKFPFIGEISKEELAKKGAVNLNIVYSVQVSSPNSIYYILNKIQGEEALEYAEPLYWHDLLANVNDPFTNLSTGTQRLFYNMIGAYDAWNYSTGDSSVTIAVIDAGTRWNHEDLIQNLKTNPRDPINNIDDDRNGLVDDYRGWDFSDDDNDASPTTNGHGNSVASFCSARGNNGIGVAGIAFTCKLLPIKIYGNSFAGYDGIAYAAAQGANVLNLSWGRSGGGSSAFEQDVVNYAANNRGAVLVAAAGNSAGNYDFYPASYDNVISVVHTQLDDRIEPFSSSSYKIDLSAPGSELFGITTSGTYGNAGTGSSLAAPIVSGTAALIKSVFPNYTPQQIAELIRINTDNINDIGNNYLRIGKMGSGRLNIFKAMSQESQVSVRAVERRITNMQNSSQLLPGDTVNLACTFQNYLNQIPAFSAQLSVLTPEVSIIQPVYNGPTIPGNQSVTNNNLPYKLYLSSNLPNNTEVVCKITYSAADYQDYEYFSFFVTTDYLNLKSSRIAVTATANGRIGFNDLYNQEGIGFQLGGKNILGEGGLLIGVSPTRLSNCVYDTSSKDNDFLKTSSIRFQQSNSTLQKATCTFNDSLSPVLRRVGVNVAQQTQIYQSSPADRVVIYTYDITNTTNATFDSLSVGLYTDFQVGNYQNDRADWDTANRMGYTYSTGANPVYAGIQVLSQGKPCYLAVDGVINITSNQNLNLFDGFSTIEKFTAISKGLRRTKAGFNTLTGNDVASITGVKIYNVIPGETRKFAFAISAGNSLSDLRNAFAAAKNRYSINNLSPIPRVVDVATCSGGSVYIAPTNGNRFKFYDSPALHSPIAEGRLLMLNNLRAPRTLYVTSIDSLFESTATTVQVFVTGPRASFTVPSYVNIADSQAVNILNTSTGGLSYKWYLDGVLVDTNQNPQIKPRTTGIHSLKLKVGDFDCADSLQVSFIAGRTTSAALSFTSTIQLYPNPVSSKLVVAIPSSENYDLSIMNAIGKRISIPFIKSEGEYEFQTSDLPSGSYFLKVKGDDGIKVIPFIKQ